MMFLSTLTTSSNTVTLFRRVISKTVVAKIQLVDFLSASLYREG